MNNIQSGRDYFKDGDKLANSLSQFDFFERLLPEYYEQLNEIAERTGKTRKSFFETSPTKYFDNYYLVIDQAKYKAAKEANDKEAVAKVTEEIEETRNAVNDVDLTLKMDTKIPSFTTIEDEIAKIDPNGRFANFHETLKSMLEEHLKHVKAWRKSAGSEKMSFFSYSGKNGEQRQYPETITDALLYEIDNDSGFWTYKGFKDGKFFKCNGFPQPTTFWRYVDPVSGEFEDIIEEPENLRLVGEEI